MMFMCHWNFRWELKSNLGSLLELCGLYGVDLVVVNCYTALD